MQLINGRRIKYKELGHIKHRQPNASSAYVQKPKWSSLYFRILVIWNDVVIIGLIIEYISGSAQDCSNSIVWAMELLQSYTQPSIYHTIF